MNILVLCTGNSARSILLESILSKHGQGRVTAFSAGSKPAGRVHPAAQALLAEKEYSTDHLRSKSWDEFAAPGAPEMDIVITVCGNAAAEECPYWPGAPVTTHWGVEDPAAAPEPEWRAAFGTAYDILARRVQAALDAPLETLDPAARKAKLDEVGRIT